MQTKFVVKARRELKSFIWGQDLSSSFPILDLREKKMFTLSLPFLRNHSTYQATVTLGSVVPAGAIHQHLQSKKGTACFKTVLSVLKLCIYYIKKYKKISVPFTLDKFLFKGVTVYAEPKSFSLPSFHSLPCDFHLSLQPRALAGQGRKRMGAGRKADIGEKAEICKVKGCLHLISGRRPEKRKTLKD